MDEETQRRRVRVIDRRWLNAEGEPREAEPSSADISAAQRGAQPAPSERPTDSNLEPAAAPSGLDDRGGPIGFVDLVDFFAQQTLTFLAGDTPSRPRDLDAARFFIDLLGVVQAKSVGQLTTEEQRYLEDVLFQLRSLFVATVR